MRAVCLIGRPITAAAAGRQLLCQGQSRLSTASRVAYYSSSSPASSSLQQQHRSGSNGNSVAPRGAAAAAAVAQPHTPPSVPDEQAPNRLEPWSDSQNPRTLAMRGARFEQTDHALQPKPLSAIEMIANESVRLVASRVVACDGGRGPLGHPKVFINLDKPGPKGCPYCGIRFEKDPHASHHH